MLGTELCFCLHWDKSSIPHCLRLIYSPFGVTKSRICLLLVFVGIKAFKENPTKRFRHKQNLLLSTNLSELTPRKETQRNRSLLQGMRDSLARSAVHIFTHDISRKKGKTGASWPKVVQMFCTIIAAGAKGIAGRWLDKRDELTSNSLISTDNSSAIYEIIMPFFPIFRNLVDFFAYK